MSINALIEHLRPRIIPPAFFDIAGETIWDIQRNCAVVRNWSVADCAAHMARELGCRVRYMPRVDHYRFSTRWTAANKLRRALDRLKLAQSGPRWWAHGWRLAADKYTGEATAERTGAKCAGCNGKGFVLYGSDPVNCKACAGTGKSIHWEPMQPHDGPPENYVDMDPAESVRLPCRIFRPLRSEIFGEGKRCQDCGKLENEHREK